MTATCTSANNGPPSEVARRNSRKAARLMAGFSTGVWQATCWPAPNNNSCKRCLSASIFNGLVR
ncbi:hypothetical protein D3C81_1708470 [compost metagenome]